MGTDVTTQESQEWMLLKKQCTAFAMSNLLPRHVYEGARNENEVLARAMTIAFKGRELGIPPLYALSSIAVINGKPALSAELMLSLVLRKFPSANPEFISTNESCSLTMARPGGKPQTFKFSIEDAKRAGLLDKKGPWHSYPRAMLKARVTSEACRSIFPDALLGAIYTPEELGAHPIDIETVDAAEEPKAAHKTDIPTQTTTGNTVAYDKRTAEKLAEPSTEAQHRKFNTMVHKLLWSEADGREWLFNKTGKESPEELSKKDISHIFDLLAQETVMSDEARSFAESENRTNA